MIPKPIKDLGAADIEALVLAHREEGSQLDFKQALCGDTRDAKKEFVADVCSFSNAGGGDIVFGVEEDDEGRAKAIIPIKLNPDTEILRLENILSDCVEPKVLGAQMKAVQCDDDAYVLVLRVPGSSRGLHRNKLDQHFWVRESRSKRSLDVPGIVSKVEAFLGRQTRITEFFANRYAEVLTNRTPLPLAPGPKAVVHVFPAILAAGDTEIDLTPVLNAGDFYVSGAQGLDVRRTFDGVMHHSNIVEGNIRAYSAIFHNGFIEGAWKVADLAPEGPRIGAEYVEGSVARFIHRAIDQAKERLAFDPPFVVRIAIVGADNAIVKSQTQLIGLQDLVLNPITRSVLVLPDVVLDTWPLDLPEALRSTFDRLWHSAGYARSFNYRLVDGGWVWRGTLAGI